MTEEGFHRRIFCAEWHVSFWYQNGTPWEKCEEARKHLEETINADFYEEERPKTEDKEINRLVAYLDKEFSSSSEGPQGCLKDYFS